MKLSDTDSWGLAGEGTPDRRAARAQVCKHEVPGAPGLSSCRCGREVRAALGPGRSSLTSSLSFSLWVHTRGLRVPALVCLVRHHLPRVSAGTWCSRVPGVCACPRRDLHRDPVAALTVLSRRRAGCRQGRRLWWHWRARGQARSQPRGGKGPWGDLEDLLLRWTRYWKVRVASCNPATLLCSWGEVFSVAPGRAPNAVRVNEPLLVPESRGLTDL